MGKTGVKLRDYRKLQYLRMDIVATLYKRSRTYRQIREEVMQRLNLRTYSISTLHKDIKLLLEEWRKERLVNIDDAVQAEIMRLRELQNEAWDAWDKSKQDYDKQRARQHGVPDPDAETEGAVVTVSVEQSKENVVCCGDPRFLDIIYKCGQEIRKLLGLYAPEKHEVTGKAGEKLFGGNLAEINAEIERLEKLG